MDDLQSLTDTEPQTHTQARTLLSEHVKELVGFIEEEGEVKWSHKVTKGVKRKGQGTLNYVPLTVPGAWKEQQTNELELACGSTSSSNVYQYELTAVNSVSHSALHSCWPNVTCF